MRRADNWKSTYNSDGLAAPLDSLDGFMLPFYPLDAHDPMGRRSYIDGNAWQYSWFVPHNVYSLIKTMGGKDKFIERLDLLFKAGKSKSAAINDMAGEIGQYIYGNEPSHHITYLYNYVGQPWKCAERVVEICNTLYTDKIDGICGNEDCGQMSAWYVFSTLGFYPLNPATGVYMIGPP